jgi:hypothetical protein
LHWGSFFLVSLSQSINFIEPDLKRNRATCCGQGIARIGSHGLSGELASRLPTLNRVTGKDAFGREAAQSPFARV